MRRTLLAIALLAFAALSAAQTVALTFDDGLDPRAHPEAARWNAQILAALQSAGIRAAYFPAGRFVDSPEGLALVRAWGTAGHAIGNHTYSHRRLEEMAVDDYTADIARGEALLRTMPGWTPRLRFPFLDEGTTAPKRDGVRDWLARNAYLPAPVTIVTSDWYYSQRFDAWLRANPGADPRRFGEAYVRHVAARAGYFERLARETQGRSPPHVMLLHTNRLNATFLPLVLAALRANGWSFVAAPAAFADPLYQRQPASLPAGNSLLTALARDAGRELPTPPEDDHGRATLDALGY